MRRAPLLIWLATLAACGGEEFGGAVATAGGAGASGSGGASAGGQGAGGQGADGGGGAGASAGGVAGGCLVPSRAMPPAAENEEVIAVTDEDQAQYPNLVGSHVYWTTPTSVWRVPKAGGCLERVATGGSALRGLAVQDGFAYFVDSAAGKVRRAAVGGGEESVVASGQPGVQTIALDAAHAYWAGPGILARTALDGSGAVETLASSDVEQAFAVAVDTSHAYWATRSGSVHRVPKTGGASTLVDSSAGLVGTEPVYLTLFENRFYWSFRTQSSGGVRTKTKLGSQSSLSAISDPHAQGIAVDGQNAYWARAEASGGIRKGPAGLGSVSEHVAGQSRPAGVAVDATHVYWTNSGDASIRRSMK